MSFDPDITLPASWQSNNPTQLSDFAELASPLPGNSKILFVEDVDNMPTNDARFSKNQDSAAQMAFWVNEEAISDVDLMTILTKTILGGWYEGNQDLGIKSKKLPGMMHPFYPGLTAADIVSIKPYGLMRNQNTDGGGDTAQVMQYRVYRLLINFESECFSQRTQYNSNAKYNPNWLAFHAEATNQRISAPLGFYAYQDWPANGSNFVPALYGLYISQPLSYITIDIHQCPANLVFSSIDDTGGLAPGTTGGSVWCQAREGMINSEGEGQQDIWFLGYPPHSLLLDSTSYEETNGWWLSDDQKVFTVHLHMIYNGLSGPDPKTGEKMYGWDLAVAPDLKIRKVASVNPLGGGAPPQPYVSTPFYDILKTVNPL